jgi:hypothetical protein
MHFYPFDYDRGDMYVRPKSGVDFWPDWSNRGSYVKLGITTVNMPPYDAFRFAQATARPSYTAPAQPFTFGYTPPYFVPNLAKATNQ